MGDCETSVTACTILSMKAELGAMKIIIVGLIASCVVSLAQTNTNNSDSTSDKNAHPDATGQLLKAERAGDTETIKMLLKNGVDINSKETADGSTTLMWAAVEGHTDMVKLFLDEGADVNATNNAGKTALKGAAEVGNIEAVKLLLARGADGGKAAIVQLQAWLDNASGKPVNAGVASDKPASDVLTYIDPSTRKPRWPADGKITDTNLLVPVSFTNSIGEFIPDAIPARLFANKLIYITTNGGGGTIRLEKLPPDLQAKFNYNHDAAAEADQVDADKKGREAVSRQQQKELADQQAQWDAALNKALAKKARFYCDVIQKIDAGLLVSSPGSYSTDVSSVTLLVKDYPHYDSVAAQDQILVSAFPIGLYSYTTVNHSENTIHVWTCSTNVAVEYYLTH
jgi:hypothetical protein